MRMTEEQLAEYERRQKRIPANLPEQIKAPKSNAFKLKMTQPSEDDEQAALAKYLNLMATKHSFRWCHVPNGGDRDVRVAARLKSHGVKRGVPDVIIFASPPRKPESKGIAIELKKRHGGVVSDDQEEWLDYLQKDGWCCHVAKGWDDARKFLVELGF